MRAVEIEGEQGREGEVESLKRGRGEDEVCMDVVKVKTTGGEGLVQTKDSVFCSPGGAV